MNEYLTFDKFITPIFIQIIFWLGVAAIVILSLLSIVNGAALPGLLMLIIGPLVWRMYTELMLVIFKINDNLSAIRKRGENEGAFK
ncbi:MAG: DUF4282 domain-containing protein [Parasphingopyxis sp.]|uniref:DUF4282 domain-containing protein n=1 Tax=Parasphingopyxis sp. TaxID=1920299 RepID=UPI0026052B3B|nr:DUF4282 domain-containing protein [uncultured Parasphingopyxis sp.]